MGDQLQVVSSQPLPELRVTRSNPLPGTKNVLLPDGRVVAFPDSMADADIAAVIRKQLGTQEDAATRANRLMTAALSGQTSTLTPSEKTQFEAGEKAGAKAGIETAGGMFGGEVAPALRGLAGVLSRMIGAGSGAAIGNMAGQAASEGGKVDPVESLKTGLIWSALQGGGEALGSLKSALSSLAYTGKVAADGTPELSKFARSIIHPTEMPENVLRAVAPPPPEAIAAAKAQAGEANAAQLEARMNEIQAARQKELTDWAKLQTQQGSESAAAIRRQALLDAQAAKSAPEPTPFPGATSTGKPSMVSPATGGIPQGSPTPFVSKFMPPEPSQIVSPLSSAPPVNKTLVSYDRNLLVHMARGGDLNALRELIRNPGGIDVASAVPNSKYLLEGH